MTKLIAFTGGGTSGHITPNIALINALKTKGMDSCYFGSPSGLEARLIEPLSIPFRAIRSGKLRRYFSWRTFLEPFQIMVGILQALYYLKRMKPDLVFSKGGFVAFPVVVAAWLARIPVVAHESDLTPGLANRLSFPFAKRICVTFEEGKRYFKNARKVHVTGTPIRKRLFEGEANKAYKMANFSGDLPSILVMGGGQGAKCINDAVRDSLDELTKSFHIFHICGQGKIDKSLNTKANYKQFEYVHDELADVFAASTIVISRAGANSVYEILALKKPHIFIPLSLKASRGDQIHNAKHFKSLGVSHVIKEEALSKVSLVESVNKVFQDKAMIETRIAQLGICSGTENIIELLERICR